MQAGEEEGGGFTGAGGGAGEEIFALHGGRDGFFLDGGGMGEGEVFDAAQNVGVQSEGRKGHGTPKNESYPRTSRKKAGGVSRPSDST